MPILFEEMTNSPTEGCGEGSGNSAKRMFLVEWAQRFNFCAQLADFTEGAYPAMAHCRAAQFSIEPFLKELPPTGAVVSPNSDLVAYSQNGGMTALVTVDYAPAFENKTWPTDVPKPYHDEGTSLRMRLRFSGQFLTIPGRMMKWATSDSSPSSPTPDDDKPTPPDMNSRILIPIMEFGVQWDFVDDPPIQKIEDLVGHLNETEFLGCPPETVLFEGGDLDDSFRANPTNPHCFRLNYTFRKRCIQDGAENRGWNHDYREDPMGWARVLMNGKNRYDLGNLADLFTQ